MISATFLPKSKREPYERSNFLPLIYLVQAAIAEQRRHIRVGGGLKWCRDAVLICRVSISAASTKTLQDSVMAVRGGVVKRCRTVVASGSKRAEGMTLSRF